jgi:hypothetical protein
LLPVRAYYIDVLPQLFPIHTFPPALYIHYNISLFNPKLWITKKPEMVNGKSIVKLESRNAKR